MFLFQMLFLKFHDVSYGKRNAQKCTFFGGVFSQATVNEFRNAKIRNTPTLIFEKELAVGELRKPELTKFLDEIKDPKTGLVVDKYRTVLDLKEKIMSALSYCLTKKFRDGKRLQNKIQEDEDKKANTTTFEDVQKSQQNDVLDKMKTFPFTARFSKEFGKAKFVDFRILSTLKKGERHMVSAKIEGSTNNGFLDLAIKDPDGMYYWYPDPQSYDSPTDNGNLQLEGGMYEKQWEFSLPDKSGKYLAIMGLYENDYARREVVDFDLKEFTLA